MGLSVRIFAGISTDVTFGSETIWNKDILQLRGLQSKDGGWKTGWLCRYGKTGVLIGNWGLTTAMAAKALKETKDISYQRQKAWG